MSDLDILQPEPVLVQTSAGEVHVFPLRLRDIGPLSRLLGAVLAEVGPDLEALCERHLSACMAVVALVLRLPLDQYQSFDMLDVAAVMQAVIDVNPEFFSPPKSKAKAEHAWSDVLQLLISSGHRLPDVLDYTLAQVDMFVRAIVRQRVGAAAAGAALD